MGKYTKLIFLIAAIGLVGISCKKSERSATTGWKYNDQKWGGFQKVDYKGQITAPNLVLVEGGTFTMGLTQEDVTYEWNNIPRRITVPSFYIDETEIANIDYRHFVFWTRNTFGESYPDRYHEVVPDTLVWREELAYNEPLVETYFRHPSFDDYPVVGVSWKQATEYCKWRTDRVNEMLMIEKGILNPNPEQKDADNFNTKSYLAGQYEGNVKKNLKDEMTGGERKVQVEDGIFVPDYRLPTEAEWEYAALGLIGKRVAKQDELISERRIYPWDNNTARYKRRDRHQGKMLANFKRGKGDYMGLAGNLNDNSPYPAPVRSYWPNDYGLYNMAGNVNEWVADVYRPLTSTTLRDEDQHDINPFRGNEFYEVVKDEQGATAEKDSLGRIPMKLIDSTDAAERENYHRPELLDYRDGDEDSHAVYDYGNTTLINKQSRVIKGGSWADRLFWLAPSARRFKDEEKSDKTIGFRCAMDRLGSPVGNESKGGNYFKSANKNKKSSKKRKYK
ncbi:MAG: SUMF1/EgtB/PvdO family nonheme iron enzyme [Saprospiraceae bacterium]|nr:SUMF1/EgtB/PvdO family nonheme iron enzyme [Saprospiraceae bacterium]